MFFETEKDIVEKSDEEILALSLRSPGVFGVLIDRYQKAFIRKASSVLHNREDSEDATQETFTKIYLNASRFRDVPGASFKSWAYKILLNTCFTLYRKKKKEFEKTARLDPEFYAALPDTDDAFERDEFKDLVASVLTRMPKNLSKVLHMHFLEGKSHKDIAQKENTTVGAVKTRVYRAKKVFRDINTNII